MLKAYKQFTPAVDPTAYIAENTAIVGNVDIGSQSSIWYGVSIRGDINSVKIGNRTNIQDNSVVHVDSRADDPNYGKTLIGNGVTIGHGAIIHGCIIEDDCLIGMGAIILTGARIGSGSLIAAGALVLEGQQIPPKSLVLGVPATIKGSVKEEKFISMKASAEHYVEAAAEHRKHQPLKV